MNPSYLAIWLTSVTLVSIFVPLVSQKNKQQFRKEMETLSEREKI